MCIYIYIHIMHIYIYTHIHTYIHWSSAPQRHHPGRHHGARFQQLRPLRECCQPGVLCFSAWLLRRYAETLWFLLVVYCGDMRGILVCLVFFVVFAETLRRLCIYFLRGFCGDLRRLPFRTWLFLVIPGRVIPGRDLFLVIPDYSW